MPAPRERIPSLFDADAGRAELPEGVIDAGTAEPAAVDAGSRVIAADAGDERVVDAGTSAKDPLDGGASVVDAGGDQRALVDAGSSLDAGTVTLLPVDAGVLVTPLLDAGSATDAGAFPTYPLDAGAVDAGPTGPGAQLSTHTALGVPDDSTVGALTRWLLVKPQFVVSYDTVRKTPRWVSWRLDTSWLGTATRATSFRRDAQLPTTVGQARDDDFRNSGLERGHLCPSADRTNTDPDNDATFVFTNVVPQTRASNGGTWATLEDEARDQVRLGKTVFLLAGPVFGVTSQFVGSGVPVPTATFKVAIIVEGSDASVASVSATTRVIAVLVPNTTSVSGNWRAYRVTVRSLEQATGFDFLSDVPREVQDVVETRLDVDPP